MTDTTTPLQPEERTEEEIEADQKWLAELRAARFERLAGIVGANLDYEQDRGR